MAAKESCFPALVSNMCRSIVRFRQTHQLTAQTCKLQQNDLSHPSVVGKKRHFDLTRKLFDIQISIYLKNSGFWRRKF